MDWSNFCDVPYRISTEAWSIGDISKSDNLGKTLWLDDYVGSNCPGGPTLAGFIGDPGIHISSEIDLESVVISSGLIDPPS